MELIRYRRGNPVPAPTAIIEFNEGGVKSFNIHDATKINTLYSTASEGALVVDKEKFPELIKALDASPWVYRAGGETPTASDGKGFD